MKTSHSKEILPTNIWIFLTFTVCAYNKRKISLKPAIAAVRSVKLNSSAIGGCKHIPLETIWLSSYFYLLLLQPFFKTDTSSETERTDIFVQGCMQESEPMMHWYAGQDRYSHTTGTYSHRPERNSNFPGTGLKANLSEGDQKARQKPQDWSKRFCINKCFQGNLSRVYPASQCQLG